MSATLQPAGSPQARRSDHCCTSEDEIITKPKEAQTLRTLAAVYVRGLRMLAAEKQLAVVLAVAGIGIAGVQLAEPVLFGLVVDALAGRRPAGSLIVVWAFVGMIGIVAGVTVAVAADRFAHRQRMLALSLAFEKAVALPLAYHAERGSGAVVGAVLRGTDELFWLWLGALREQLVAILSVVFLIPLSIYIDYRLAIILAVLAVVFTVLNVVVVRRTMGGQAAVEEVRYGVSGRVGDVISNVTVVQSYTRLAAEVDAMRGLIDKLLAAQYPVLTWWGVLTVLQRSAATIAMVAIFAVGAMLAASGETSVGASRRDWSPRWSLHKLN
ncbi:MAG: ABC transporter transmembrane domain-containing protein, partial [Pseudomonadota bacterium]